MKTEQSNLKVIPLIKSSVNLLLSNKIILFPLIISVFIQLLTLEILFFYPRFPLDGFFGPLIRYHFSEVYMHYPSNFLLLPKLFQYAQVPIYILISSFFVAVAIRLISLINEDKKVKVSSEIKSLVPCYISIVLGALVSFVILMAFFRGYGLVFRRASIIKSQSGIYYIIKQIVILGAPYFNMLLSIIVSTIFAYVIPIIAIEKKQFFSALLLNFKVLFSSFWITFMVTLIPSLLYVPYLILRQTIKIGAHFPEVSLFLIVLSVFIMFIIDAIVYTTLTTIYLVKKETK